MNINLKNIITQGFIMNGVWKLCLVSLVLLNLSLCEADEPKKYATKMSTLELKEQNSALLSSGAEVSFISMTDLSELTIEENTQVSHCILDKNAKITINPNTHISHLTLLGKSIGKINGGEFSSLTLHESSEVTLHKINIAGGSYQTPTVNVSGGTIAFSKGTKIHFYASYVELNDGKISGFWKDGTKFSIWLVEKTVDKTKIEEKKDADSFIRMFRLNESAVDSLPKILSEEIIIHEIQGPSFDCKEPVSFKEKEVCTNNDLAKLDLYLSQLYHHGLDQSGQSSVLKNIQTEWLNNSLNVCKDQQCLAEAYASRIAQLENDFGKLTNPTKKEEVSKNEPSQFKKVIFEPRIVYSRDKALCEAVLQNHQKEFYKGSDRKNIQNQHLVELPWKSQLDDGQINRIVELGKIDLKYVTDKKRTLLRWIEPFNWRGETHSAFFYPSALENVNFKELNATDLTAIKAQGKAIYPDFNITDWNQSTYNTYATEWIDVKPFTFHNKYYFENNVNEYSGVRQKYITTLEILEDGKLQPTCVLQTKQDGENPLQKLKNVGALLDSLANMTGGYGDCGTLGSGHTILGLRIPTTLEKVAYYPWKEALYKDRDKQINIIHSFLKEWGYRGLWNYNVFMRYEKVKDEAKKELKQYYIDMFSANDITASKYAERAYNEILSAHFNVPYYGLSPDPYDVLRKALLEGRDEKEIKPMLIGNWQYPESKSSNIAPEQTLFYALKYPQLVAFLIKEGADVNAFNGFGKTALMYAAQYNLYETAELLIKSGIDVNKQTFRSDDTCANIVGTQGVTALHYAVRYSDAKFIELLVKNGANKDIKDSAEKIAFDWVDVFSKENKYLSTDDVQQVKKLITPMPEDEKKKVIQNHVETARKLYSAKEYEKAASFYEKALLYDNKNAMVWSDLALVYYRMGEYPKAAKAASKNMYSDKATLEQQASAFYNIAMICGVLGNYISYEGQGYCHHAPLDDFIQADMKRSTPDRVAKILEMLSDDYRPKFTYSHVLLESSDKKQKIVYSYPRGYLFTQEPLSDETSVAVTYKSGVKGVSSFRKWHEITFENEHYYIYRNTDSISLGNQNEQRICYDKACHESVKLNVIYQNREY